MKERSRHNSKQRRPFRIALIAAVVITFCVLLPSFISIVSAAIMTPIRGVNTWLEESSSLVPTFFRDRRDLLEQIEELEQRVIESERSSLTQKRLVEENNHLRTLLGIAGEERIAAAIIARPGELPYDLLEIDRGSDHGIMVGSPVFIGRDIVIGLVVHVAPTYSFVQLVTTPGFTALAFITGPNVVASLEGMGGGVARVRVPQGVPLAVGNLVNLPSVEPGVFGRIAQVENSPTQPEQYGYVTPDIPLSGLFRVSVGKQSQIARSAEEIDARVQEAILTELYIEGVSKDVTSSTSATTSATTTTVIETQANQ